MTEFELKFQVPAAARAEVEAAVLRGRSTSIPLAARYFDTADEALRRQGLVLRLRREGKRWVQAAKGRGGSTFDRLEHEVPLAGRAPSEPNPALHAGTPVGERLIAALAGAADARLHEVHATEIVRLARLIRSGATDVEVAFDQGRLRAGSASVAVLELEFELKSGRASAVVALAERWCRRHGLWLDPLSKAETAWRLANRMRVGPPVRFVAPTQRPASRHDLLLQTMHATLAQCLANGREVAAGVAEAEHVHQLRIGLRRLRTLVRELRGFEEVAQFDPAVEASLVDTFRLLGRHRDIESLIPALQAEMAAAGGPPLAWQPVLPDVAATVRGRAFQEAMLGIVQWLQALDETGLAASDDLAAARAELAPRLSRLLKRSVFAGRNFAERSAEEQHTIRKRLKRLRYLSELVRPLYPQRKVDRFLDALKPLQAVLGAYQDAAAGRQLWQAQAADVPSAWFGVGWLSAREASLALDAAKACRRAAKAARPFW